MSKKKMYLIILTNNFPFGNGENFIKQELTFLLKRFAKVFIITNTPDGTKQVEINSNVYLYFIPKNDRIGNIYEKLKIIFSKTFRLELLQVIFKYKMVPYFKRLLNIAYYIGRGELICNVIKNVIEVNELNETNTVIYSYWFNENAAGAAFFKKKNSGFKFIFRCHGYDLYFYRNSLGFIPLRSFISKQANSIFPISNDGEKYLMKFLSKKSKTKILTSRLGVGFAKKNPIFIESDFITIVSCSRIVEIKRVDLIIKIISLCSFNKKINWIHFGGGENAEKIIKLASKMFENLPNVKYEFKGEVENDEVLYYYQSCLVDLFINLSSTEGIPVSIMEAMAHRIPVIATNVGGTKEIVFNGYNGYLVDYPDCVNQTSIAIMDYVNMSFIEKKKFRENAYNTWNTYYNCKKNYSSFTNYLLNEI